MIFKANSKFAFCLLEFEKKNTLRGKVDSAKNTTKK
jgi:hypothetical protein